MLSKWSFLHVPVVNYMVQHWHLPCNHQFPHHHWVSWTAIYAFQSGRRCSAALNTSKRPVFYHQQNQLALFSCPDLHQNWKAPKLFWPSKTHQPWPGNSWSSASVVDPKLVRMISDEMGPTVWMREWGSPLFWIHNGVEHFSRWSILSILINRLEIEIFCFGRLAFTARNQRCKPCGCWVPIDSHGLPCFEVHHTASRLPATHAFVQGPASNVEAGDTWGRLG